MSYEPVTSIAVGPPGSAVPMNSLDIVCLLPCPEGLTTLKQLKQSVKQLKQSVKQLKQSVKQLKQSVKQLKQSVKQ